MIKRQNEIEVLKSLLKLKTGGRGGRGKSFLIHPGNVMPTLTIAKTLVIAVREYKWTESQDKTMILEYEEARDAASYICTTSGDVVSQFEHRFFILKDAA